LWLPVWCRRTDELVDGPNAAHITPAALNRWENRLEEIFNGKPYDMLDAALAGAVQKFPVDIQVSINVAYICICILVIFVAIFIKIVVISFIVSCSHSVT
jgi:hypothetical protein